MDKLVLSVTHPELALEWHLTANGDLTPEQVLGGSHKVIWWKCPKGDDHVWKARVESRVKGTGCPYCSNKKVSKSNCLATTNPELANEWHPTKNGELTPYDVTAGSHEKVWWKCPEEDDHEWSVSVESRSNKRTGCPICSGHKVAKSTSLAATHPEIAIEWDTEKNGELSPYKVSAGSNKKVSWKCSKDAGHVWESRIADRALRGQRCPICSGYQIDASNSLAGTHPELAKEWHYEKNGELTPNDVKAGSHYKVWWKCPKGDDHEWQAIISNRALKGRGCPVCSGRVPTLQSSLATTHPVLTNEWHPTKNLPLTPFKVSAGSHYKVGWECTKGPDHEWIASIATRALNESGCPICINQKVVTTNSLAITRPDLASEWDFEKNGNLTPYDVVSGSGKKVWWKCSKGVDHIWFASIEKRDSGQRCPYCSNKKVSKSNCLATTNPEIANEWHPTKNRELTPNDVTAGSHRKVWWKCPEGDDHEWKVSIEKRVLRGDYCPICSNRKVAPSNCLAVTHPQLILEWDKERNGKLTPYDVVAGSGKHIWWKCLKNEEHIWKTTVNSRVIGTGCPYCNLGWSLDNIKLFVRSLLAILEALTPAELYTIFQQNGLLNTMGKCRSFVKALVTGKFPKEEIEKFVDNKPSLVDEFVDNQDQTLEDALDTISKVEINEQELDDKELNEIDLPVIETKDVLSALDNSLVTSSADAEAVEFLITSGTAKVWKQAFFDEKKALEQAESYIGGEYATQVKNTFLRQYKGAKELEIPKGYNFKVNSEIANPNLMQRLVAYQVRGRRRVGNWSGTGAGKTLSAILASRVIDANLTIICCPNTVVKGWRDNINLIFPGSKVHVKTLQLNLDRSDGKHHYLVLNYEAFQQENSEGLVKRFVDSHKIDFIVIDEIHYSKQRIAEDISKRRRVITGMISMASETNPDIHILGMSATPVINNLYEGKTLLEMITGIKYDDLNEKPTVNNCMALYQKLATTGTRWMPNYKQHLNLEETLVDCTEYLDEIKALGVNQSYVDLEAILTKAKLPEIRKRIKKKTLIYTHYIKNITDILKEEIEKDGWEVAFYMGDDKSGLERFLNGSADVLIATSTIGTGVDGLQRVCNRLIVNILPWTHAEFEQLKGRIYRQGQVSSVVDVIVPLTYAVVKGQRWSWCESKWKRIKFKKDISDAAVDGIVPEGHLRTPAQAYEDVMNWLKRLNEGNVNEIERRKIYIPLEDNEIQKRVRSFGDFSKMNARINSEKSSSTHKRFQDNPEEWETYHALYREARKDWLVVPYEEIINWCRERPSYVIGDFGCGEAKLAESLENTVYSFDHIAINGKVIACDMSHVPLEDEILDVAVFSLSLMGANFTDYILEAHRCLKLDGRIIIAEATSRFSNTEEFKSGLEMIGFDNFKIEEKYRFTFIMAIKSKRKANTLTLIF